MKKLLYILVCFTVLSAGVAKAQIIVTIAGDTLTGGAAGYNGDGIPAVHAALNGPYGVCIDGNGNTYIADRLNNRIRKVDASGMISTIAGTGVGGYNGDNIAATAAQINEPVSVATDGLGNVYIADLSNNRVRKVNSSGIITTVAGDGTAGFGGDNGPATAAEINNPRGVAADASGNVYIGDYLNSRIRKVDATGTITTIAGNGSGGFSGDGGHATAAVLDHPMGVAVDAAGNVFFCDVDNERVRKINTSHFISTVAGTTSGGYNGDNIAATTAMLAEPIGVAIDRDGNIYIGDGWNSRIRKVDHSSGLITTVVGSGVSGYNGDSILCTTAEMYDPYGVAVDSNYNIYIADVGNNRIRYVDQATTGIVAVPSFYKTDMYPNPCSEELHVNISSTNNEKIALRIFDVHGVVMQQMQTYTNQRTDIHTGDLPPGNYIVVMEGRYGKTSMNIAVTRN